MTSDGRAIGGHPANAQHGAKTAGPAEPGQLPDELDLASDIKGKNSLQGEDQERHMNQRQAQADAKGEPDKDLLETFKKMDKDYRAEAERQSGKPD